MHFNNSTDAGSNQKSNDNREDSGRRRNDDDHNPDQNDNGDYETPLNLFPQFDFAPNRFIIGVFLHGQERNVNWYKKHWKKDDTNFGNIKHLLEEGDKEFVTESRIYKVSTSGFAICSS